VEPALVTVPSAGDALTEFACKNVWERGAPVLQAVHDHNGDWQMLCGSDEHVVADEVVVVHKEHLAERDPSLLRALDLPSGWEANRDTESGPWERIPFIEEEG
jgi:hypothetical protein